MKRLWLSLIFIIALVGVASADTLIAFAQHDGYASEGTDQSWFGLRNDVGDANSDNNSVALYAGYTFSTTTPDIYGQHIRGIIVFNRSSISPTDTLTSAILSVYSNAPKSELGTVNLSVINASPANPFNFANGDYHMTTFTRYANDTPSASVPSNAFTNISLNAAGLSDANSQSNLITLMLTHSADVDNTSLTWANGTTKASGFLLVPATNAFANKRPFITIEYSAAATPPDASFTVSKNLIRIPYVLTCTDTSTESPTSWQWSWGDGSANSTDQNPTHKYTKRGMFTVSMTATNAGGSDVATSAIVRVIGYENY